MKLQYFLIAFFIISINASSKTIQFDILKSKEERFDLKEVCKIMGLKHNVMVGIDSIFQLDCMGYKVKTNDFCQKKFENNYKLLRGLVIMDIKKVVCQFGEGAYLRIKCVGKYLNYCKDSKKSCGKLKKIYALKLDLFHSSILLDDNGKRVLGCKFITPKNIEE